MAVIMKGSEVSSRMKEMLLAKVSDLKKNGVSPTLAVVRVGNKPDDLVYERSILKRFTPLGIDVQVHELPEDISQADFDSEFMALNDDSAIHGILLFQPLPEGLSSANVRIRMNPLKDIDGMSPLNEARIFEGGSEGFAPCTASAVMTMLAQYGYDPAGKNVVIVGRSMVIGRPLSMLMLRANATVTVCHSKTQNLPEVCRRADILVAAVGHAKMITPEYVTRRSVVVDVGIDTDKDGNLCGDVDFEQVSGVVQAVTPVPGGVGAVTTSVLAENLLKAAKLLCSL
ncbi:MAG: bifunctional 5,10-methylenetetrahydrofolate dehydrogenase/5,10-methenyltetrahydrofolate cyclohydrolase [Synergistaceae bacterium]|nr:bifunctional 5,10-methylenetetrahydrofolate dehydrogenase/5,10-methenyltetrahydrofolate cyclohydrolase [Synergistaceae bacterium]